MRKTRINRKYIYSGIDRVDNNKGYEDNNVVACCWKCNNAKAQQTKDEFLMWAKLIVAHTNKSIITSIV